jgi:uncharacterized protein YutE (UPF0331/DUF86 family)
MINGVIFQKLQSLDEILTELRSLGTVRIAELEGDWRTRRAIEQDLRVMVEIVIDICQRLIALAGQTPAPTSGDAVERCIQLGALSNYDAYRKMVQFRNFVVHRYERVDVAILVDMVNHRLVDFARFRAEVQKYAKR